MLSASRSQKQNFSEKKNDKLKSKSASPTTLRKPNKEPSQEERIQSSTNEREAGKLTVQEIVSISCVVLEFIAFSLTEGKEGFNNN